eukprot:TRINITY_DN10392_c0_g2_i1.p3 TRINITY_DN10392_c0_g2~~TRINITY_DN10392_c0_g2_i1.p3  ORF type:complete len:111 (-),score=5.84 TRINITY_DN10392_c0_g2_i1:6-338(-)
MSVGLGRSCGVERDCFESLRIPRAGYGPCGESPFVSFTDDRLPGAFSTPSERFAFGVCGTGCSGSPPLGMFKPLFPGTWSTAAWALTPAPCTISSLRGVCVCVRNKVQKL